MCQGLTVEVKVFFIFDEGVQYQWVPGTHLCPALRPYYYYRSFTWRSMDDPELSLLQCKPHRGLLGVVEARVHEPDVHTIENAGRKHLKVVQSRGNFVEKKNIKKKKKTLGTNNLLPITYN